MIEGNDDNAEYLHIESGTRDDDLCRDPEVTKETVHECCDLLQKMYAFATSLDPPAL